LDSEGNAEGCCECYSFFNNSECCYNTTFCRCEVYGGGVYCSTDCICDGAYQRPAAPDRSELPTIDPALFEIDDVIGAEVAQALAFCDSRLTQVELAALSAAVKRLLVAYFKNNPNTIIEEYRENPSAGIEESKRRGILAWLSESGHALPDDEGVTDFELYRMAWVAFVQVRPLSGLAIGQSRLLLHDQRVRGGKTQGFRVLFPVRASTTWLPVLEFKSSSVVPAAANAPRAGFLFFAQANDKMNGRITYPFILTLEYDLHSGRWAYQSLWTTASGAAVKLLL